MRVYFTNGEMAEYLTATHWAEQSSDWMELTNDREEIVAILNWKHVTRIEFIP